MERSESSLLLALLASWRLISLDFANEKVPSVDNAKIADVFEELADLSDLGGNNPHMGRAYRVFASTVRGLTEPLESIWKRGEAQELKGVGKAIGGKLNELFTTGTFDALERARIEVPASLLDILRVPGLGPKRARALWQGLGITSLGELEYACRENRLLTLPGFGEKTQARALAAVTFLLESQDRIVLGRALDIADEIGRVLVKAGATRSEVAGEARRGVDRVSELVVVACGIEAERAQAALLAADHPADGEASSNEMLRVLHEGKTPVRVRLVSERDFVSAWLMETGDVDHLRWLSELARERGQDLATLAESASDEASVYRAIDLVPVPPELREGAAPQVPAGLLPRQGLSGVFHAHTDWSDGTASVEAMAKATRDAGFRYLGISDHSKAAAYARGLDSERLSQQAEEIAQARKRVPEIAILHGIEVDILRDGSLDLDDDTLSKLDFVIASVHSSMVLPPDEMTARLVRAVSHPLVTILGHPTGRLLLGRKGYAFDVGKVVEAAVKNDTYLEINASRYRLDLGDALVRRAAALGARFAIDPDAHGPAGVKDAELGVLVARRAGLPRERVLNAAPADAVLVELAARKERALLRL